MEVRLENGHNCDVLDKHLRFIMNPPANFEMADPDLEFLYKPLFEVITLGKKKIKKMKKKKVGQQWVNRLYYNKPDYSMFLNQQQNNNITQFTEYTVSVNTS